MRENNCYQFNFYYLVIWFCYVDKYNVYFKIYIRNLVLFFTYVNSFFKGFSTISGWINSFAKNKDDNIHKSEALKQ